MAVVDGLMVDFFFHEGRGTDVEGFFMVWIGVEFVGADFDEMVDVDFMAVDFVIVILRLEMGVIVIGFVWCRRFVCLDFS